MQKNENKKTKTKKKKPNKQTKKHILRKWLIFTYLLFLRTNKSCHFNSICEGRKSPSDEHNSVLKLGKSSCRNRTDTTLVGKYQLKRLTRTSKYFLV